MPPTCSIRVIKESGQPGKAYALPRSRNWASLGRHPECDIRIDAPSIAELHALVRVTSRAVLVQALDRVHPVRLPARAGRFAADGTSEDALVAEQATELADREAFVLGPRTFRIELDRPRRVPAPSPPRAKRAASTEADRSASAPAPAPASVNAFASVANKVPLSQTANVATYEPKKLKTGPHTQARQPAVTRRSSMLVSSEGETFVPNDVAPCPRVQRLSAVDYVAPPLSPSAEDANDASEEAPAYAPTYAPTHAPVYAAASQLQPQPKTPTAVQDPHASVDAQDSETETEVETDQEHDQEHEQQVEQPPLSKQEQEQEKEQELEKPKQPESEPEQEQQPEPQPQAGLSQASKPPRTPTSTRQSAAKTRRAALPTPAAAPVAQEHPASSATPRPLFQRVATPTSAAAARRLGAPPSRQTTSAKLRRSRVTTTPLPKRNAAFSRLYEGKSAAPARAELSVNTVLVPHAAFPAAANASAVKKRKGLEKVKDKENAMPGGMANTVLASTLLKPTKPAFKSTGSATRRSAARRSTAAAVAAAVSESVSAAAMVSPRSPLSPRENGADPQPVPRARPSASARRLDTPPDADGYVAWAARAASALTPRRRVVFATEGVELPAGAHYSPHPRGRAAGTQSPVLRATPNRGILTRSFSGRASMPLVERQGMGVSGTEQAPVNAQTQAQAQSSVRRGLAFEDDDKTQLEQGSAPHEEIVCAGQDETAIAHDVTDAVVPALALSAQLAEEEGRAAAIERAAVATLYAARDVAGDPDEPIAQGELKEAVDATEECPVDADPGSDSAEAREQAGLDAGPAEGSGAEESSEPSKAAPETPVPTEPSSSPKEVAVSSGSRLSGMFSSLIRRVSGRSAAEESTTPAKGSTASGTPDQTIVCEATTVAVTDSGSPVVMTPGEMDEVTESMSPGSKTTFLGKVRDAATSLKNVLRSGTSSVATTPRSASALRSVDPADVALVHHSFDDGEKSESSSAALSLSGEHIENDGDEYEEVEENGIDEIFEAMGEAVGESDEDADSGTDCEHDTEDVDGLNCDSDTPKRESDNGSEASLPDETISTPHGTGADRTSDAEQTPSDMNAAVEEASEMVTDKEPSSTPKSADDAMLDKTQKTLNDNAVPEDPTAVSTETTAADETEATMDVDMTGAHDVNRDHPITSDEAPASVEVDPEDDAAASAPAVEPASVVIEKAASNEVVMTTDVPTVESPTAPTPNELTHRYDASVENDSKVEAATAETSAAEAVVNPPTLDDDDDDDDEDYVDDEDSSDSEFDEDDVSSIANSERALQGSPVPKSAGAGTDTGVEVHGNEVPSPQRMGDGEETEPENDVENEATNDENEDDDNEEDTGLNADDEASPLASRNGVEKTLLEHECEFSDSIEGDVTVEDADTAQTPEKDPCTPKRTATPLQIASPQSEDELPQGDGAGKVNDMDDDVRNGNVDENEHDEEEEDDGGDDDDDDVKRSSSEPAAVDAEAIAAAEDTLQRLTVRELRNRLKAAGESVKGVKKELVARLADLVARGVVDAAGSTGADDGEKEKNILAATPRRRASVVASARITRASARKPARRSKALCADPFVGHAVYDIDADTDGEAVADAEEDEEVVEVHSAVKRLSVVDLSASDDEADSNMQEVDGTADGSNDDVSDDDDEEDDDEKEDHFSRSPYLKRTLKELRGFLADRGLDTQIRLRKAELVDHVIGLQISADGVDMAEPAASTATTAAEEEKETEAEEKETVVPKTVRELREFLAERGLCMKGGKEVLLQRARGTVEGRRTRRARESHFADGGMCAGCREGEDCEAA